MTIYEQLIDVLDGTGDRLATTGAIKAMLSERYRTNPSSILPSDYCYNRWNQGLSHHKPLFVRVGSAEYRYLGPDRPYTGLVFWRPKGAAADQVRGERVNGTLHLFNAIAEVPAAGAADHREAVVVSVGAGKSPLPMKSLAGLTAIPLSPQQLDRLYEEYMEILALEVGEFGCKATETRHLIGRLGEFFCARMTQGQLARRVNQAGFDVVGNDGRRISVKTTAQQGGFVSLNGKTTNQADDLMVLRYDDGLFEIVYHDDIAIAVDASRVCEGRYEFDLAKARALSKAGGLRRVAPSG